jgi:hypothetical protein
MLNYSIRLKGFHLPRCGSPDPITPNRSYLITTRWRGGMWGQHFSLIPRSSISNFISMRRNSTEIFLKIFFGYGIFPDKGEISLNIKIIPAKKGR